VLEFGQGQRQVRKDPGVFRIRNLDDLLSVRYAVLFWRESYMLHCFQNLYSGQDSQCSLSNLFRVALLGGFWGALERQGLVRRLLLWELRVVN
jgi:hypothetical protein